MRTNSCHGHDGGDGHDATVYPLELFCDLRVPMVAAILMVVEPLKQNSEGAEKGNYTILFNSQSIVFVYFYYVI